MIIDTDKLSQISDYLESIWPSVNIEYEYFTGKELHKFSLTKQHHKQAVLISDSYLCDHRIDVILTDMDNRHVKDIIKSSDNPGEFFLGYNSNGAVIFIIVEKK